MLLALQARATLASLQGLGKSYVVVAMTGSLFGQILGRIERLAD